MTQQQEKLDWKAIRRKAGPYPIEAFNFIREGLCYTAQRTYENIDELPEADRHISGRQLCLGLRDFAIDQYGMLASTVLQHWHIRRTEDFGRIVFAMIDSGLMTKTDEDTLDDFRGIFDFGEAFNDDELIGRIGN